jgi:hypothetical protein
MGETGTAEVTEAWPLEVFLDWLLLITPMAMNL